MDVSTFFILVVIGVAAGILAGFIGVGGGIIIVPALIYFLGLSQHMAQGTSLALMLPPIGILAVYNYHRAGEINFTYAAIIAIAFVIGGFFGSKLSLKLPSSTVKFIFGVLMLYVAIRMIGNSYKSFFEQFK
ncbi:MAG: sulfite exporter TauE/SafE family protein [Flavobacteriales bacterium]|nr:sulfite exporter TauE/SafE family protein [Flavobacteriales bacterium]